MSCKTFPAIVCEQDCSRLYTQCVPDAVQAVKESLKSSLPSLLSIQSQTKSPLDLFQVVSAVVVSQADGVI